MSIHFVSIHHSAVENRKNLLKPSYIVVEGHSRSLMLIVLKSTLPVLVTISSTSVPRPYLQAFSRWDKWIAQKSPLFKGLSVFDTRVPGLVKRIRLGPRPLKYTFNAENFICGCFGLSPAISAQFSLEMCVAVLNRKKFTKTSHFRGSRSFKVIDLDIPTKLVTSACYDKQHVYAYLQPFSRQTRQ